MGVVDLFNQIADNSFGFFQQVRIVSDMMTPAPECLSLDDTFETAVAKMEAADYHHLPVLNPDDDKIVGIVSDRDLLRHRPPTLATAGESDSDVRVLQDSVTRFMTRSPAWCTPDCSPIRAMSLMLDRRVDSVLVSPDGNTLEGIVTPRDFIKTLLLYHRVCTRDFDLRRLRLVDLDLREGVPLDEIYARGAQTVRDVMSKNIHCVSAEDCLCTAIERMQQEQTRHLVVIDDTQRYCGFLSDRDILKCLPPPSHRSEEPERFHRQVLFATEDTEVLRKRVDAVMHTEACAATPDMLLCDAMQVFEDGRISGMPVVNPATGYPSGVVTTSDILRVFRVVMQIGLWADPATPVDTAAVH